MKAIRGNKCFRRLSLGLSACALALFTVSCGNDGDRERDFSQESRKPDQEWFWRDRLSARPDPLPAPSCGPEKARTARELMERLRGRPPAGTEAVQDQLLQLGEEAAELLCEYASDPERTLRWAAVSTLCRMASPRGVEALANALRDEWDAPAILAASRIGACGERWILPRLIKVIGPYPIDYNPHLMVRVKAAAALIRLGNFSGVPFLIKMLKDNTPAADPDREWDATTRLAWEKEEALAALAALAGDDFGYHVDAPLEAQARAAMEFEAWWRGHAHALWKEAPPLSDPLLGRIIMDLVNGLASYQARNADGSRYCLKMLGPPVFPFLVRAFRSDNFYERFHGLDVLSQLAPLSGDQRGDWVQAVIPLLEDTAPAVRMKAALALGQLKDTYGLAPLGRAFSDPDPDVRLSAAKAVGLIGGDEACALLEGRLDQADSIEAATEIKAALVRANPKYDHLLLEELIQEDPDRQVLASEKLAEIFGEEFDFPAGAPLDERRAAAAEIKVRMESVRKHP